jgi:hypothetical protein
MLRLVLDRTAAETFSRVESELEDEIEGRMGNPVRIKPDRILEELRFRIDGDFKRRIESDFDFSSYSVTFLDQIYLDVAHRYIDALFVVLHAGGERPKEQREQLRHVRFDKQLEKIQEEYESRGLDWRVSAQQWAQLHSKLDLQIFKLSRYLIACDIQVELQLEDSIPEINGRIWILEQSLLNRLIDQLDEAGSSPSDEDTWPE